MIKPKKINRYCEECNTFHDPREECQRRLEEFIEDEEGYNDLLKLHDEHDHDDELHDYLNR